MDFRTLQLSTFQEMGENFASPAYWSLDDVKTALNDGYEETSDLTEWYESSRTITITPPTRYTAIFSASAAGVIQTQQILTVTKVYDSTRRIWLQPITAQQLDAVNVDWELARGDPDHYMLRGAFWFGVYPFPTATSSYTVYTREIPYGATVDTVPLVADGDTPGFPADWHHMLVKYACYDLHAQDGEFQKAKAYYDDWMADVESLKRWTSNRASYPTTRVIGAGGLWPV